MNLDFDRLAHAVREARTARGWRQEDLADRAHVGVSSVQNVEKGRPFSRIPSSYRKMEEALAWGDGSFLAILQGDDPTPRREVPGGPVKAADGPPSRIANTPPDDLPVSARIALENGQTFDADVMHWQLGGEDFSVIIVAKVGKYDTEEKRQAAKAQYEVWARMKERMRQAAEAEVEGVEPQEPH